MHARIARIARIAGILAVLQVIFGTAVTIGALMLGSLLVAVLGLLIISSAATSAVLLWWVRRVDACVDETTDQRTEQRDRQNCFNDARGRAAVPENRPFDQDQPLVVNLAKFGPGDPSPITAATLDRSTFPRLARTMDDQPPAQPARGMKSRCIGSPRETSVPEKADRDEPSPPAMRIPAPPSDAGDAAGDVAVRQLQRTWTLALRDSDLAACRGIYATLVNVVDPARVMPLTGELERLIDQTEQSLRHQFSACILHRDHAGALVVGERMRTLLFDRPVARAFERIKPLLLRAMTPPDLKEADPCTTAHGT